MTRKVFFSILLLAAISMFNACDNMDSLYKDYRNEQHYSGKISGLDAISGNNRVVLSWINPKDQISKGIKIVYGIGDDHPQEKVIDELVSEASVEGLENATYLFSVYTLTADGNESVPVSIQKAPFSIESLKSASKVVASAVAESPTTATLIFGNISTQTTLFAGSFKFTCKGSDGSSFDYEHLTDMSSYATSKKLPSKMTSVSFKAMPMVPGVNYTITYTLDVYPGIFQTVESDKSTNTTKIVYKSLSIDSAQMSGEIAVTVK